MLIQSYYWEIKRKWFFCCPKEVPLFSFMDQRFCTHYQLTFKDPFFPTTIFLQVISPLGSQASPVHEGRAVARTLEFSNCLLREWVVLASCKLDWGEKSPYLYNGKWYSLRFMGQVVNKVPLASHILELSNFHRWLISSSYHENVDHTLTSTG